MPAGANCVLCAGARTLNGGKGAWTDVVCLIVRAWLSEQAGGLGANAVTEDRAVGVLELECVWYGPV